MGKSRERQIIDRAVESRRFIHIHGFLIDGENEKVKNRINKRLMKEIEKNEKMRSRNL